MDDWDKIPSRKSWGNNNRCCDMKYKLAIHKKGKMYVISQFSRSASGLSFEEIKRSEELASVFAEKACEFLSLFVIGGYDDWCLITTPRRRSMDGYHFSADVCQKIAKAVEIKFYDNAIQCLTKNRIKPEFYLLRELKEENVIVYDDIMTTGSTLNATYELLKDKKIVLFLVGIKN